MGNRVSVHITSKDRSSELCALLHSLRVQTYKDWDLVLLDDAYGTPIGGNFKFIHDVLARLKLDGHGVQILRNNVSNGVCKARQKMIDEDLWPENPYILRLDDDQILEVDYLERLVEIMDTSGNVGIVSGVTPLLSGPDFRRKIDFAKPMVNKIVLDDKGDIIHYADDCGYLYDADEVLPAHQFRSSALMRREMFTQGLTYEKGLTMTGFREEAFLSLRALLLGWHCIVNTGAVAWHAPANSGGCRSDDYARRVSIDDSNFREWVKLNCKAFKEAGL